jgi:hypothetical protein
MDGQRINSAKKSDLGVRTRARALIQEGKERTQWLRWIAAVASAALDSAHMARSKKPPSWSPVAIERDGKAYSGKFHIDGRLITVLYNGRTKTTHLGSSDATAIASRLLSELLPEK